MLWYCVLLCRIQHGDEVPTDWLTERYHPDHALHPLVRVDGQAPLWILASLMYWTHTDSGSSVSLVDEGFLTAWRSDIQSGTMPVGQAGASVNNSGML